MERKITFKGNPLTLTGRLLKIGDTLPDFKVVSPALEEVSLAGFGEKIKVITSFPSLDTPVCDLQVKEFNKRAAGLGEGTCVIAVSKDLPFAQKRFCDSFGIADVTLVSDYKTGSFGINYGLLIKELNLLARAVLIADKNNTLRYVQIVKELTTSPDYKTAMENLQEVLKDPARIPSEAPARCKPCEGGVAALPQQKVQELLARHRGWELVDGKKLTKEFLFSNFMESKYFFDQVALLAEEQGHHPSVAVSYQKVKVALTTHAAAGLTDNDFIMARIIDQLLIP